MRKTCAVIALMPYEGNLRAILMSQFAPLGSRRGLGRGEGAYEQDDDT